MPKKNIAVKTPIQSKKSNLITILALSVALLCIAGIVIGKKMMVPQSSGIFEIRPGAPVALTCGSIAQFTPASQCQTSAQFRGATFSCSTINGTQTVGVINNKNTPPSSKAGCMSVSALYAAAYKQCASVCVAPSPTPSNQTPTPTPSIAPSPTPSPTDQSAKPISCQTIVYKIPPEENGSYDGSGYFKAEYIIDPAQNIAKADDRYAYQVKLQNPNPWQVGGDLKMDSKNINGASEPITEIAMGGACSSVIGNDYMKFITCTKPNYAIEANDANNYPNMTFVVKITQNSSSNIPSIGTTFTGTIGASQLTCSTVKMSLK